MIIIIISLIFHQTWWNSKDFAIITQIHSSASFLLVISVINSRHWYGKPPTLLRDLGPKNQLFCLKSAFLKRRKYDDHMISWILIYAHFSLKSGILAEKFFKIFWGDPFLKICKKWPKWAFVVSGVFRTNASCDFTKGIWITLTL